MKHFFLSFHSSLERDREVQIKQLREGNSTLWAPCCPTRRRTKGDRTETSHEPLCQDFVLHPFPQGLSSGKPHSLHGDKISILKNKPLFARSSLGKGSCCYCGCWTTGTCPSNQSTKRFGIFFSFTVDADYNTSYVNVTLNNPKRNLFPFPKPQS